MSWQALLVDYLGLSFKDYRIKDDLLTILHFPLEDLRECPSKRHYEYAVTYCNIFYLHWTVSDDKKYNVGCYIELTGQGCRMVESLNRDWDWYGFLHLFDSLYRERDPELGFMAKIPRLDLACDLHDDDKITMEFIAKQIDEDRYKSKVKRENVSYKRNGLHMVENIYVGAERRSDRYMRIYDKAYEQRKKNRKPLDYTDKWLRFEFQLMNDCAMSAYLNLVELDGDFSALYFGILNNFVTFTKEAVTDVGYSNTTRLTPAKWWSKFLGDCLNLSQLYLPGIEYSVEAAKAFLQRECSSTMRTVYEAADGDLTEIISFIKSAKLNLKQQRALAVYRVIKEFCNDEDRLDFDLPVQQEQSSGRGFG